MPLVVVALPASLHTTVTVYVRPCLEYRSARSCRLRPSKTQSGVVLPYWVPVTGSLLVTFVMVQVVVGILVVRHLEDDLDRSHLVVGGQSVPGVEAPGNTFGGLVSPGRTVTAKVIVAVLLRVSDDAHVTMVAPSGRVSCSNWETRDRADAVHDVDRGRRGEVMTASGTGGGFP